MVLVGIPLPIKAWLLEYIRNALSSLDFSSNEFVGPQLNWSITGLGYKVGAVESRLLSFQREESELA